MTAHAITYRSPFALAAATLLVAGAARPAVAQGRALFSWNGRVDREVVLVMRDGDLDARPRSGDNSERGSGRVESRLPHSAGTVQLRVQRGRGFADVVQQPSAANGYTTMIRLRDDASGSDGYAVVAYWQPSGTSGNGGWITNGSARNDDGRWSRDDDRDRDRGRDNGRRDNDDWDRGDRRNRGNDDRGNGRGNHGRDNDNRGGWGGIFGRGNNATSGALRWRGRVDAVQEIRIRGRQTRDYTVSGNGAYDVDSRINGALPSRTVDVYIRQASGRGAVRVVQQPRASNDYTAVIRIDDRQGGAGYYDFEATWR